MKMTQKELEAPCMEQMEPVEEKVSCKEKSKKKAPRTNRQKLIVTTSVLLIAALLLTGVGYAWLVLSIAPEVSGISTQIGSNGALEIVLLNKETREDLSQITSGVGSNINSWSNLVDLSAEKFGLANITLYPARLNIEEDSEGGYKVKDNYLLIPSYDHKGQVVSLNSETYGVTYNEEAGAFKGDFDNLGFGVRGYGSSSSVSVQAAALALAKTNVSAYTSSASNNAASTLNKNTQGLLTLVANHKDDADGITNANIDVLGKMISGLEKSADYIDKALRQGLIAYAASSIADKDLFNSAKDTISTRDLSTLADDYDAPEEFKTWASRLDALNGSISNAKDKYNDLVGKGDSHSWDEVTEIMNMLISLDTVILSDGETEDVFDKWTSSQIMGLAGKNVEMALPSGSGVFADIANFTDNYSTMVQTMGTNVSIYTLSTVKPSYLKALSAGLVKLSAAGSSSNEIELTDLYGYAIDLAFRCNAPLSELLLQTNPISRVSQDDEDDDTPGSGASTMGAGSYMEFSLSSKNYTTDQAVTLMDALRVAFIDDSGKILGIAKLNTSNRTIVDDVITAPLYLYEYDIVKDPEAGGNILKMGERRGKGYNDITGLDQNVAKAVTTLVWLDGDVVDNTMVSSDSETSLSGVLNLQFASSANLVPADNLDLSTLTPDKSTLEQEIAKHKETYDAGQKTEKKNYTTESWNAFTQAYDYAQEVYTDATATERQVANAIVMLQNMSKLQEVSFETLNEKIAECRKITGKTSNIAGYLVRVKEGEKEWYEIQTPSEYVSGSVGTIYAVDDSLRTQKQEDGTTITYTIYSWTVLADAIYKADALALGIKYTSQEEIDNAISALEDAKAALIPNVTKVMYDYEGEMYYRIETDEDADNYGMWFDSKSQKITSDLTILKLESYAETAKAITVDDANYLNVDQEELAFYPNFNFVYPEITGDQIVAIEWDINRDDYDLAMTASQNRLISSLKYEAQTLGLSTEDTEVLFAKDAKPTYSQAKEIINDLKNRIDAYKMENTEGFKKEELPIGFTYADFINKYEANQKQVLYFDGTDPTRNVTMTATILTEKGFVFDVDFDVTLYAPSTLKTQYSQKVSVEVDKTAEITVSLEKDAKYSLGETVLEYSWSSDDRKVATVTFTDGTCTITGVEKGETVIRVSVYTKEGNVYTKEFEVEVK